jgi:hypothetical protein
MLDVLISPALWPVISTGCLVVVTAGETESKDDGSFS